MSGVTELYGKYTSLQAAIREDLFKWECRYWEKPDAIFLSGEAYALLCREFRLHDPCTFATQPLYPVPGPIQPPVREHYETLFGIRVHYYAAPGIEYYFARKGAF